MQIQEVSKEATLTKPEGKATEKMQRDNAGRSRGRNKGANEPEHRPTKKPEKEQKHAKSEDGPRNKTEAFRVSPQKSDRDIPQ